MGATLGINTMLDAHNVRPHGTFQADVKPMQHDFVTLRRRLDWQLGFRLDRVGACPAQRAHVDMNISGNVPNAVHWIAVAIIKDPMGAGKRQQMRDSGAPPTAKG